MCKVILVPEAVDFLCIKVNSRRLKVIGKDREMRSGLSNPLSSPNWYIAPISHEYFPSFTMVNLNSPNQSLDLGPSSHITIRNSLDAPIFFEGFKNFNLI